MTARSGWHTNRARLAWLLLLLVGCSTVAASDAMPHQGYGIGDGGRGLIPGRDFVEAQVIIGLRHAGSTAYTPPAGGQIEAVMHETTMVIQFASEEAAQRAIPVLVADPRLSFVERNGIMRIPPMPAQPKKDPRQP